MICLKLRFQNIVFIAHVVGSAFVYRLVDTVWTQTQELTASDGNSFDNFGIAVSLFENTIVIGAYLHSGAAAQAGMYRTDLFARLKDLVAIFFL